MHNKVAPNSTISTALGGMRTSRRDAAPRTRALSSPDRGRLNGLLGLTQGRLRAGVVVFGDPIGDDAVTVTMRCLAFVLVVAAAALIPGPTRVTDAGAPPGGSSSPQGTPGPALAGRG